ncbi:Peptidyl-prolyl cis-trans isomerase PpiD [Devosia sp. H5989]|nr:Peptidyl-prolyl cis-trans isomerase PpiD [Devosia sp. H5989]
MLDSLRSFSKTFIAKVFFAVLIVSFAAFGISNVITNLGSTTVARVGDEDISTRDFQRAYQQQLQMVAQQIGQVPTPDQANQLGVPSMTLSRLSSDAAVNQLANQFGLGVSEDKLAELVRNDPSFGGTLGGFNRQMFVQVLAQNGFTESEYLAMQSKVARRQQLATGLFGDTEVPDAALSIINHYMGDKRTVDYFVLNSTSLPPVAEPTEDDLTAYLKDHQSEFRTKETRTVDLLVLSPETLAATKTPTDEEIAAEYERTKDSLTKAEQRTIVQAVLPDDAAVKAFTDGKAAGKSFEDILKETQITPTVIGTLSKPQVTDPALAEAAFGLAKAGDFVLIPGIQGQQRAISVSDIVAGGTLSLAEAKDQVAKNLALSQAKAEYGDVLDQVEELRATLQPLTQIAERFKLPLVHLDLTPGAPQLSTVSGLLEGDAAKIGQTIFAAEANKLTPSISLAANRNAWFDLSKIEPARDQTLAEVHDAVAEAWTNEKTEQALADESVKILAQLDAGTSIADIAASLNQFPEVSAPLDRQGDGTPVFNAQVANAIFDGGPDHHGTVKNADGDYVVFKVSEVTPASGDLDPRIKTAVEDAARNALYGEFVSGVRDQAGVHINQAALNQLLSTSVTQ